MKGSLLVVLAFGTGILLGRLHAIPTDWASSEASTWMLCCLIAQAGLSLGGNPDLKAILLRVRPSAVALPFLTVAGTLLFSALASLLLSDRSATDCLAVGSGMGYYSLSSVLIAELRTPACGAQLAAELGTLALLANILRELAAFFCAPWIARRWGGYALVSVAGAGSMDSVLPVIGRHCGEAMLPVAIFHGVVLEGLIPVLVTFFCGI